MAITGYGRRAGAARGPARRPAPDLPPAFGRQQALDGLRVLAAAAVLITVVGGETGLAFTGSPESWLVSRGEVGVPIFFVLSALLLYRPWAAAVLAGKPPAAIRAYLVRRALRILPAYWAVVIVALLTLNGGHARSPWTWAQYLLLLQNYDPHPWWSGAGAAGLAQMWTLTVEASFYAVLPLIAIMLTWYSCRGGAGVNARARRLLTGIAILGAFSYCFTVLEFHPHTKFWIGATLPALMTWFAPGLALAVVSAWAHEEAGEDGPVRRFCRTVASSGGICWLIAALLYLIACTPAAGPETLAVPSLWAVEIKLALFTLIAAALVAPAAFQPARMTGFSRLLGNRVMRYLARISYGVFLWQYLVIYALLALLRRHDVFHGGSFSALGGTGFLLAVAALAGVAAVISLYCIEIPARRAYRLIRHQQRSGQPADDHQAQQLRDGIPEPGGQAAAPAGPAQVLAKRPGRRGGQQQAGDDPGARGRGADPGSATESDGDHEQGGRGRQQERTGIAADPQAEE